MGIANYSVPQTLLVALLGMGVVFAALILLILLMALLTRATARRRAVPVPEPEPVPVVNMVPAKGSLGDVALFDVDDRTAAFIMAVVADELQKPLNELRFRSIRERQAEKGVNEL